MPLSPGPLATWIPTATLSSPASSLSLGQSAVCTGRRILLPQTGFAATAERECGVSARRGDLLALAPLPNPSLESNPKQSSLVEAAPTGILPELPAPPHSKLPGLRAQAEPGARRRQGRAGSPRSAAKYFSKASWLRQAPSRCSMSEAAWKAGHSV